MKIITIITLITATYQYCFCHCERKSKFIDILTQTKVLPVLHDLSPANVKQGAEMFWKSSCLSISLRHSDAINSFSLMKTVANSNILLGASTVVSLAQIDSLKANNIDFISTTFYSEKLVGYAHDRDIPILCGVSSYSDAREALAQNVDALKFYPTNKVSPSDLRDILLKLQHHGVLISTTPIFIAGGVKLVDVPSYLQAGATGFAIGINCEDITSIKVSIENVNDFKLRIQKELTHI